MVFNSLCSDPKEKSLSVAAIDLQNVFLFLSNFFHLFYFLALLCLHCFVDFSLVAASRSLSNCGAQASFCSGLSSLFT